MGFSFHYRSKIEECEKRRCFLEEMQDIGKSMKWHGIEAEAPKVHGIVLNPAQDCEPIPFLFTPKGSLLPLAALVYTNLERTERSKGR